MAADYWAVTVAAEVSEPNGVASTWFLELGVHRRDGRLAAAGPPAIVPSPLADDVVGFDHPALAVPRPDDALAATAAAFLEALLADGGDVSRYLAPGLVLEPVDPAPFTTVAIERAAAIERQSARAILQVEAVGTTPAGSTVRLSYELTLEERAGRWEVRRATGAPTRRATSSGSPPPRPAPEPSASVASRPGA